MVRFALMIVVALLVNLFAVVPAFATNPPNASYQPPVSKPPLPHDSKKCGSGETCEDMCYTGALSRTFCCGKDGPRYWGYNPKTGAARECVQGKTLVKPVPPKDGIDGRDGKDGIDGAPGTSVKVTQAANGAIVEDGQGNTAIIKDGKNGDDRPLNAEVGMVTGLRQTGGTPVFNLGADLKLIFKDLWYLKFAWQFGTALVDHDDRQFQSVVQVALGLRLDAFSPNLGLDLGIGAEYSQTGTLPFSGWDRRSWTAKVESDLYLLVWAGVADEWKRFFKIGVNLGLGEEFKPGSTASNLLFDATVYLGINAVF